MPGVTKLEKITLNTISDCYNLSKRHGDAKALRKILFLMKSEGCTLAYKSLISDDKQYNKEIKLLGLPQESLVRYDFFKEDKFAESNYLGYIQIRPSNHDNPINDAFIRIPETKYNSLSYFITCNLRYKFTPPNGEPPFVISGTFFCQRDGRLGMCAHASLRMLSYFSNNLLTIHEIKTIAQEPIFNQNGEIVDSSGLEAPRQIDKVLKHLEYNPVPYNKPPLELKLNSKADVPTEDGIQKLSYSIEEIIYTYVESHIPVLVVIDSTNHRGAHMMVIVGHTFDSCAWWPEANVHYYQILPYGGYLKSSSWVGFIGHDDNFGPYLNFPRELENIQTVIVPLPTNITLRAELINPIIRRIIGNKYIKDGVRLIGTIWSDCLLKHLEEGKLLFRTFLVSREEFLKNINESNAVNAIKDFYNTFPMPDIFWITEVSVPEIFSQQRYRLGEIIIDATGSIPVEDGKFTLTEDIIKQVVISIHLTGYVNIPRCEGQEWTFNINNAVPYRHIIRKTQRSPV